ncbi:MAG: hypothetical protein M1819_006136 [Sarea resinae]|nr:MAG: hypothetical protein M1819_006136 [Sarea resinae]
MSTGGLQFRRVGRGGAGNFYSKKELEDAEKRAAEDLEAQKSSAHHHSHADDAAAAAANDEAAEAEAAPRRSSAEYAHTGRGGAGNWVSEKELAEKGTFTEAAEGTNPVAESGVEAGRGYRGRGGAGNYEWAAAHGEEKEEPERSAREAAAGRLNEKAVLDVEAGLTPPAPAHLSP